MPCAAVAVHLNPPQSNQRKTKRFIFTLLNFNKLRTNFDERCGRVSEVNDAAGSPLEKLESVRPSTKRLGPHLIITYKPAQLAARAHNPQH